jgi:hypothetical protein
MADRTSSSSGARRANPRAGWSLVCGVVSLAAVPAGVVLAHESRRVTVLNSSGSIAVAVVVGFAAVVLGAPGTRVRPDHDRPGGR